MARFARTSALDHAPRPGARADQALKRPSVGGARPARRPGDGRLRDTREKVGVSRLGALFLARLKSVLVGDPRGRRTIAEGLGVPARLLERWLAPSEPHLPRFDLVLQLLTREDLLPPPARRTLWEFLDHQAGRTAVDLVESDPDDAPVPLQVLQIASATGRIAREAEAATAELSPEGRQITPGEALAMLDGARDELREAAEYVGTLERIAGVRR